MESGSRNATFCHGWQMGPTTRGTSDILFSSLVTWFLCIWSALHLNVGENGFTSSKVFWFISACFIPELTLVVSIIQCGEARSLWSDVRGVLGQHTQQSRLSGDEGRPTEYSTPETSPPASSTPEAGPSPSSTTRFEWTMAHSYYVAMGGFSIDLNDIPPEFRKTGTRLTSEGFKFLLNHEPKVIPNMKEGRIQSKSKASGLAKLIYFVRLRLKMTITLLETISFVQCVFALLIFFFWWSKPVDLQETTMIKVDEIPDLIAFMAFCDKPASKSVDLGCNMKLRISDRLPLHASDKPKIEEQDRVVLTRGSIYQGFELIDFFPMKAPEVELDLGDMRRWQLAGHGMRRYGLNTSPEKWNTLLENQAHHKPFLKHRIHDLPRHVWMEAGQPQTIALGLVMSLYGLMHLLALNHAFYSPYNRKLWRDITIVSSSVPVGATLIMAFYRAMPIRWVYLFFGIIATCGIRITYIALAIIDLRNSEKSAFTVPRWSQFMPHIG
ncbi:hypothetical protein B0J11DRAFT_587789 [Dendryphion nanum]|uniref:Uncharacterized protein n=1 Tax=Dendryphion nanum TaxID=256645 RepID=A0A9P9EJX6_9PLEO|nr:hypothetical protein B0J11DRAFT_587789 [Dendryphion nanum]